MQTVNETLFRAICLCFSGLLLVLLLLADIDLAAERERGQALLRETEALTEENARLSERAAEQLSLEAIERFAREELGMLPCESEQIVYLEGIS